MKQIKKIVLMALTAILVFCVCASVFVACDNESKTTYTIKIDSYDETKGEITLAKEVYDENEDVTVTVTPKDGYEVKNFYVGVDDLTNELYAGNGTYVFKATSNTSISVEWQTAGTRANERWQITSNAADIDESHGSYSISPFKLEYMTGDEITITVNRSNNDYDIKSVLINNVDHVSELLLNHFTYKFNIKENVNIEVVFEEIDWTVITDLTDETFELAVSQGKTIVDLWFVGCQFCEEMEDILTEGLSLDLGYKYCKVNIDDNPIIRNRFPSSGYPTILLFKDGEFIYQHEGTKSLDAGPFDQGKFDINDLKKLVAKA